MIYEDVTEEQKRKAIDTLEDTITKSQDKKMEKARKYGTSYSCWALAMK